MRRLSHAFAVALLVPLLFGCTTVTGPDPFQENEQSLGILGNAAQFGPALTEYSAKTQEADRRLVRDKFVAAKIALIDIAFLKFARTLSADKKMLDAVTEGTQLSLGIAATLVGGIQAKENLAAAIALVTGSKATVDKYYFNNQAIAAILSTMVALRKERFTRIYAGLQSPTDEYSLVQASQDLGAYETAGTMDGAVMSIQGEASARETKATEKIDQLAGIARNVSKNLTPAKRTDKAALARALDPKKLTTTQAEAALRALGQTSIPTTLEDQIRLLQFAVIQARTDDAVDEVKAAFTQAGIKP